MKSKTKIIIILMAIILTVTISIPINVMKARKDAEPKLFKDTDENNTSISQNRTNTIFMLYNANNVQNQEIPIGNEVENVNRTMSSEEREAENEMYEKFRKGEAEANEKSSIVNNLLKKYYGKQYEEIENKINEYNKENPLRAIALTSDEEEEIKLIIKLYEEKSLSNKEKNACKYVLSSAYSKLSEENNLKNQIKKIIK